MGGISRFDGDEFVNYSVKNGLENNNVQDIAEDQKGRLWLGTNSGLSSFDGKTFKNYNVSNGLPLSAVSRMIIARDATTLWIYHTFKGMCRVDVSGDEPTFRLFTEADGLAQDHCDMIVEDTQGKIWFGGQSIATRTNDKVIDRGLTILNGEEVTRINHSDGLPSDTLVTMLSHRNGYIYFATNRGLVRSRTDQIQFENISYESLFGFPESDKHSYVRVLATDRQGNMWYGTNVIIDNVVTGLVVMEDLNSGKLTRYVSVAIDNTLLLQDPRGVVHFVGDGRVITINAHHTGEKVDILGIPYKRVRSVTEVNGIRSSENYGQDAFAMDNEGSVWFAHTSEGISRFTDNGFSLFKQEHGLPHHQVWCITEGPDGTLYFGTDAGVASWSGHTMTLLDHCRSEYAPDTYSMFFDRQGNFWKGHGSDRISKVGPDGTCTMMRPTLGQEHFNSGGNWSIFEAEDSSIWVGTYDGGFGRYKDGAWERFYGYIGDDSLFVKSGFHIAGGLDEDIWFAAIHGLTRYDGEKFYSALKSELTDGYVLALAYDHSHEILWVGTSKGLASVKLVKGHSANASDEEIKTYFTGSETEDPMNIYSVMIDRSGHLWIGHSNGLMRIKLGDDGELTTLRKFHKSNGFWPVETMQNALLQAKNGDIWIGSSEGLMRFVPTDELPEPSPPRIHISEVLLDFNPVDWDSLKYQTGFFSVPEGLILDYHQNHVTIRYRAIRFTSAELTRFRYRLIRNDESETWSPEINLCEVTFPNLSPGQYVFELQARSGEGPWSESTNYRFEITPPFWQTASFYLICALGFGSMLFFYVKFRERKLKRDKAALEKQVELRTEEVRAAYDEISEKNIEITSSIQYAKRIQNAVFPTDRFMSEALREYFIFYRPKDIIAGDFYWVEVQENTTYFAAADCTGHGVPGAMVSVMCNSALNRSVREFDLRKSSEILDKVRQLVIGEFEKSGEDVKDGMDISLCAFSRKNRTVEWTGAHNPLWVIHSDGRCTELKPDKQPVGKFEFSQPFTSQSLTLQKGDMIFVFSDGFADQFGGPRGKKYKYQSLRDFLISIRNDSCEEQKNKLVAEFENWKKGYEQIDDVCVFGVRVD